MAQISITDPIWVTKIDHPDQPGKIGVSICLSSMLWLESWVVELKTSDSTFTPYRYRGAK